MIVFFWFRGKFLWMESHKSNLHDSVGHHKIEICFSQRGETCEPYTRITNIIMKQRKGLTFFGPLCWLNSEAGVHRPEHAPWVIPPWFKDSDHANNHACSSIRVCVASKRSRLTYISLSTASIAFWWPILTRYPARNAMGGCASILQAPRFCAGGKCD